MKSTFRNFVTKYSILLREEKIESIRKFFSSDNFILDVGVWCRIPEPNPSENWLEKQYSLDARILAVGLDDMRGFKEKYPAVICVQADGCDLPFRSESLIAGHSNAVLEHVSRSGQLRFIEELSRVVIYKAIIAVPDRFCPIEIHSRIFFLHWLPNWRGLFQILGETYWSSEKNLSTLFTSRSLQNLLNKSNIAGKWKIKRQKFMYLPVSLLAIYEKGMEN